MICRVNLHDRHCAAGDQAQLSGGELEGILLLSRVVFVSVIVMMAGAVRAADCSDIRPTQPQNSDSTYSGSLDVAIGGVLKKLLDTSGDIEGTYRNVVSNILPQFPNADRVYVWERILFLECELMNEDKNMTSAEKRQVLIKLLGAYNQPPPSLNSASQSNTLNNSGSGVNAIQGNGNSVSISGGKQ